MEPAQPSSHCQNCGAPLAGRYCAACGQKDEHRILPLKHLLHEIFHDILHLDARFLKSVGMLLRPGALTLEYLAGRRVRWFPPFRLYLLVSLVFFALVAVHLPGDQPLRLTIGGSSQATVIGLDGQPLRERGDSAARSRLARNAAAINRDPSAFVARLVAWLPRLVFLLLPLFALLLQLVYLRSGTLFAQHVVFSLHFHGFLFLAFTAVRLLGLVPFGWLPAVLVLACVPAHLVLALRRVYRQGWVATLLKAAVVGTLHFLAMVAGFIVTLLALLYYA